MADEPNELTGTPRDLFAALQRHFREQAVRADGLEKTHKAWAPIVLEELPRLKRELEESQRQRDAANEMAEELARERGTPSPGDSLFPRAVTWHGERANWIAEVDRLRFAVRTAEARADAAEKRMADMLDHPDVKAAALAKAQAALAEAQAKVAALATVPA